MAIQSVSDHGEEMLADVNINVQKFLRSERFPTTSILIFGQNSLWNTFPTIWTSAAFDNYPASSLLRWPVRDKGTSKIYLYMRKTNLKYMSALSKPALLLSKQNLIFPQ